MQFRKVLGWNPNHYGATFQLARALDQGGKRGEARPWWILAGTRYSGHVIRSVADPLRLEG